MSRRSRIVRRFHRKSMLASGALVVVKKRDADGNLLSKTLERRDGYVALKPFTRDVPALPESRAWLERKKAA